jgi:GT2 family glycosyltransferase
MSVLVVSYNTKNLTLECLRSITEQTPNISSEIIVIDNASVDGSADAIRSEFPSVQISALDENIGFGRATNLAARSAHGRYVVLLNPDTVVLDRALEHLHTFMETHPRAGAGGGRTLLGDGSLDPGSVWGRMTLWSTFCAAVGLSAIFPRSEVFDPESLGRWERDTVQSVEVISGCLLIMRRKLWNRLGGFDPRFFMYCEDADLCLRVQQAGLECQIDPDAVIVHYSGASETVKADKMVRLFGAKRLYFEKHWPEPAAWIGTRTLSLHAATRMTAYGLFRLIAPRHQKAFRTWVAIWRRRSDWTTPRRERREHTMMQNR